MAERFSQLPLLGKMPGREGKGFIDMKAWISRAVSGRFGRNIAWMSGATILGHGLFLLASPVLTRLFEPEGFAELGILMTLQALLLAGMTGRLEWSVPTAGNRFRAAAIVLAALTVLVITTVILALALWLYLPRLSDRFSLSAGMAALLLVLPLSVLARGVQAILHSWCVSEGVLKPVAVSKVLQSAAFVMFALAAGWLGGSGIWLAAAFVASHILGAGIMIILPAGLIFALLRLRATYIWRVVKRFAREAGSSLGSSLMHNLAFYLPFLMMWIWYDETVLGWFAFVFRIGTAPLSFLSQALAKSFWSEAADLVERDPARLQRLFLSTLRVLALIALPFAVLTLAAPLYFEPVFGADWAGAGAIMAAMTPMFVSALVFSSTNHLIVYRRQHWQMWSDALSVVIFGGVFWASATSGYGAAVTLGVASLAFLASYGVRFGLHLYANRLWMEKHGR